MPLMETDWLFRAWPPEGSVSPEEPATRILKLQRIAPVQRQLDDARGIDHLAERGGAGFDLGDIGGDGDAFVDAADGHLHGHAAVLVHLDAESISARRS